MKGKMRSNSLPNFFIIGAAKAGTTTLAATLKQHSRVYLPYRKEPAYFCDDEYYQNGVDWYRNTFYSNSSHYEVRGDATPRYLYWGEKVVPRIQSLYGEQLPRLIAIFRNPVDLVRSYYWHSVRFGRETLGLREALQAETERVAANYFAMQHRGTITHLYSKIGNYASQLQPFMQGFPRKNFLFLLTEDLNDFPSLLARLEGFLHLEHEEGIMQLHENRARLPRNQNFNQWLMRTSDVKEFLKKILPLPFLFRMKKSVRNWNMKLLDQPPLEPGIALQLRRHYKPEIQKLEEIIQRDLSRWYLENETSQ